MTALAQTFPGQRIYVPWAKSDAMALFVENFGPLIGTDKALTLIDQFGGLRIIIPTRAPNRDRVDTDRVESLTDIEKLTAQQIAAILKCDPRSVYAARARARKRRPAHHHTRVRKQA